MMQTNLVKKYIIWQRLSLKEVAMLLEILKKIVSISIAIVIAYLIITSLFAVPHDIAIYILIGLGLVLVVIGILSNLITNSPMRVGAINRAEFYGVLVTVNALLFQWILHMSSRIDQIMLLLAK